METEEEKQARLEAEAAALKQLQDETAANRFNEAMKAEESRLPGRAGVSLLDQTRPDTRGRMYMGPAMTAGQESAFAAAPEGARINLMPPPTGPAPTRLQELQALDRPPDATGFGGSKTLSIRPADPFSDASVAHARNAAVYDAVMKIRANAEAGIPSSPELQALAMSGGATGALTPAQAAAAADRRSTQAWREQQAESKPDPITSAVRDMHKKLLFDEVEATDAKNWRKSNQARLAREAFETEHPELGLTPKTKPVQAPSASKADTKPTVNSSRMRVKGPNGETGTIEKGKKLPAGWEFRD